ncbi:invasin domain 3-containing protein [Gracilimonas sp.]|uniref:invasin domain 3-containing protein n=1 Tax=Gracilimonas sp. TaxID=1974203 RepID=UPI003BA94495
MRKISLLLCTALFVALLINSCKSSDDDGVIIQGQVVHQQTREPVIDALVQITDPGEFSNTFTRTDSIGQYSLGALEILEITDLSITASAPNFTEVNRTLKVTPKDQITGFDFELPADQSGDGDNGDDEPSGPSGGAAAIELAELSTETINIAATGGNTSSTITFEVQDSSGNSIDLNNAIDVEFSIVSGPGGGEEITPLMVTTNAQGKASATLKSGNSAGVVKVQARIERTVQKFSPMASVSNRGLDERNISTGNLDNTTPAMDNNKVARKVISEQVVITSEPVAITIHGGFPDANHFSISSSSLNYEYVQGLQVPISVLVGDEFSNPVTPGTAVYFNATNGVIAGSAEGHTNQEGKATVNLNPDGTGNTTVTATTVDKNNQEIQQSLGLLFSSSKANIVATDEVSLNPGESTTIDFTVTDRNGNPMASGTSIQVTTEGSITLSGTTSTTLGDELNGGNGITSFTFNASVGEEFSGSQNVEITVSSPSGVTTTDFITINSTGGVVTGDPEAPASMELVSLSNETINIAESGGKTNSTFTFQVQDSAGRALDSQSAVDVEFSILSNPGGASITPTAVRTDAQGRATSNLNAGNTAGVVQIQAQVVGTSIISKPVAVTIHGGFPDANHFTLEPLTETNIEGFDRNGASITYKVRAGDEFSNPVKPGTAVYFETTGGVIDGSGTGHTDETGYTEVTLYAGNPRPGNGQGIVTAKTTDADGNEISQTSPFIFSTSKADITPDITELELGPDESFDVGYEVIDLNGNPMPAGTRIEVTTGGNGGVNLTGVTSYVMPNELSTGQGTTDFSFTATAASNFSKSETIYITATSPSGTVTTNSELTIYGTGGGVSGTPSAPAAIVLENVQRNTINIKETGGIVNSSLTFQVQDSAGRPLDLDSPVDVEFEIIQGPGGGEGVLPAVATTNSTGRVTTNVFSGNTAGVLQIQARIEPPFAPATIRSNPVAITIHGGFPDFDHFSIAPTTKNIEGFNINGTTTTLEVIVGDKFSNPVKPGTAVYFETTGGVIEGSAVDHTDDLGRASVTLQSGNPRGPLNDGDLTVTARTIDENSQFIERTADVVFSTSAANISTPDAMPFDTLAPGGGATFSYTVIDLNGNPMPAGTEIQIDGGDGIEITGDANFTLGDHINPGSGTTNFQFSIRDTDEDSSAPADITIQIRVITPSGNVTTFSGIYGVRRLENNPGTPVNTN